MREVDYGNQSCSECICPYAFLFPYCLLYRSFQGVFQHVFKSYPLLPTGPIKFLTFSLYLISSEFYNLFPDFLKFINTYHSLHTTIVCLGEDLTPEIEPPTIGAWNLNIINKVT